MEKRSVRTEQINQIETVGSNLLSLHCNKPETLGYNTVDNTIRFKPFYKS